MGMEEEEEGQKEKEKYDKAFGKKKLVAKAPFQVQVGCQMQSEGTE